MILVIPSDHLYARGNNEHGQLGLGHKQELQTTARVDLSSIQKSAKIMQVAGGGKHTLLLTDVGDVFGWGRYDRHQIQWVIGVVVSLR